MDAQTHKLKTVCSVFQINYKETNVKMKIKSKDPGPALSVSQLGVSQTGRRPAKNRHYLLNFGALFQAYQMFN